MSNVETALSTGVALAGEHLPTTNPAPMDHETLAPHILADLNPHDPQDFTAEHIQEELRQQRRHMTDVLESLPRGITQLEAEDAAWLIEAVKTLGVSRLQASALAARLLREPWGAIFS